MNFQLLIDSIVDILKEYNINPQKEKIEYIDEVNEQYSLFHKAQKLADNQITNFVKYGCNNNLKSSVYNYLSLIKLEDKLCIDAVINFRNNYENFIKNISNIINKIDQKFIQFYKHIPAYLFNDYDINKKYKLYKLKFIEYNELKDIRDILYSPFYTVDIINDKIFNIPIKITLNIFPLINKMLITIIYNNNDFIKKYFNYTEYNKDNIEESIQKLTNKFNVPEFENEINKKNVLNICFSIIIRDILTIFNNNYIYNIAIGNVMNNLIIEDKTNNKCIMVDMFNKVKQLINPGDITYLCVNKRYNIDKLIRDKMIEIGKLDLKIKNIGIDFIINKYKVLFDKIREFMDFDLRKKIDTSKYKIFDYMSKDKFYFKNSVFCDAQTYYRKIIIFVNIWYDNSGLEYMRINITEDGIYIDSDYQKRCKTPSFSYRDISRNKVSV